MMLEKYSKVLSKKQKASFVKHRKYLAELAKEIEPVDAIILEGKKTDGEMKPLQTAKLCFSGSTLQSVYQHIERKGILMCPGDISKNLPHILRVLSTVKKSTPIVWKTDGYYSEATANFLK